MIDREHVDRMLADLADIEHKLSDPAMVRDRNRYRNLLREHSALVKLRDKARRYFDLQRDIKEHGELAGGEDADPEIAQLANEELAALERELPGAERELMAALVPPDPDSGRNGMVEIRAGTGGNEAALFVGDLLRMYCRYAETRGWKTCIIDAASAEIGGYKEIIFSIEGDEVYGTLKFESGVHRVQRVPVTEASGRIHTSAATVAVFPEADADDKLDIAPDEIRVDIFRSSGPGGQSVNTASSAVRITHLPTGLVAQCQDERSQHRNRDKAIEVLKARILDMRKREKETMVGNKRRSLIGSGDRSERIRTYNFQQNRITDHRINLTIYSLDRIMEGELNGLLDALHDYDIELRLANEPRAVAKNMDKI